MTDFLRRLRSFGLVLAVSLGAASALAQLQIRGASSPTPQVVVRAPSYSGDYIVAVVNSELVTAAEVEQRIERMRMAGAPRGGPLPPVTDQLRQQALDSLIEERALLTYARDSGMRVDEAEIDRAVQSIATQNKLTMPQLRERLRSEGLDYARFRANLRDQILLERVREREVGQRTRVTDAEVDKFIAERTTGSAPDTELNIAQILVIVPEGASAETVAQRQARAEAALARARRRGLRHRGPRGVRGRQPRARRRNGPAPGVAPAGHLRRAGARPAAGPGGAERAAFGRRLPCAEAARPA